MTIFNKLGFKNLEVEVNSLGDKDSINDFLRKLNAYIKKNYNFFPSDLRQNIKKNPLSLINECKNEWKEWQDECPKSIDFLSSESRQHFKEILEFLEIMEIPYSINPYLVGDINIGNETIFSITSREGESPENIVLAYGYRYNRLAKKIGLKKEIPSCFLNLEARVKKPLRKFKLKKTNADFYLVQFGTEARLKSFLILKELFRAGASVYHSIAKDKLSSQIGVAESSDASYIILIGQKEALENSVAIRHSATRAQEIVPIQNLAQRVKEITKK